MKNLLSILNAVGLAILGFVGLNPDLPSIILGIFPQYAQIPLVISLVALWGALVRYAQVRERRRAEEYAARLARIAPAKPANG